MSKRRMLGVFDPIAVAFILVIAGTIASLTLDTDTPTRQTDSQATADAAETQVLSQSLAE